MGGRGDRQEFGPVDQSHERPEESGPQGLRSCVASTTPPSPGYLASVDGREDVSEATRRPAPRSWYLSSYQIGCRQLQIRGEPPSGRAHCTSRPRVQHGGIAHARQLHGRELSFNNLMDADAAWRAVTRLRRHGGGHHQALQRLRPRLPSTIRQRPIVPGLLRETPFRPSAASSGSTARLPGRRPRQMSGVFYEVVVAPGLRTRGPGGAEEAPQSPGPGGPLRHRETMAALRPAAFVTGGLLVQSPGRICPRTLRRMEVRHQTGSASPSSTWRTCPSPGPPLRST